jgi:hypothetical protein
MDFDFDMKLLIEHTDTLNAHSMMILEQVIVLEANRVDVFEAERSIINGTYA